MYRKRKVKEKITIMLGNKVYIFGTFNFEYKK